MAYETYDNLSSALGRKLTNKGNFQTLPVILFHNVYPNIKELS